MTVSYQSDVASSSSGGLIRLLFRWRGSIWKLVYRELVLYIGLYLALSLVYRFAMDGFTKRIYERIVVVCGAFVEMIPLSFILGFYVSFTATRWWDQFKAIPWPDKLMHIIALYVPGVDENSRMLRRTLMRYVNLTLVLVLRSISIPVKRRFPTKEHLVEAGFMTKTELDMFSSVPSTEFNTYWIPCTWFINLLRQAKAEAKVPDSCGLKLIMEEFNVFRANCGLLWAYDWVSIPLVYTQVVTMATYAFFLISVIGRQHIDIDDPELEKQHQQFEYYVPIFTTLQFFFYMGLLKLGEQLINPFGDDDEDFELNWIIDRHIKVSYLGVDILNSNPPPLVPDPYYNDMDIKLPYTESSLNYKTKTFRGSASYATHGQTDRDFMVVPEFTDDIYNEEQLTDGSRRTSSIWTGITLKTPSSRRTSANGSWYSAAETNISTSEPQTPGEHYPFAATRMPPHGSQRTASTSAAANNVAVVPDAKTATGIKGDTGSLQSQTTGARESAKRNTLEVPIVDYNPVGESSAQFGRQFSSPPDIGSFNSLPTTTARRTGRNLGGFFHYVTPKWLLHKKPRQPVSSLLRIKGNELRIRPFIRSKVTFSIDEPNSPGRASMVHHVPTAGKTVLPVAFSSPELTETELLAIQERQLLLMSTKGEYPAPSVTRAPGLTDEEWSNAVLRRLSLDDKRGKAKVVPDSEEDQQTDPWLHHRSLPNIQEVDGLTPPAVAVKRKGEDATTPATPSPVTECPFKWPVPPGSPPKRRHYQQHKFKKRSPIREDQESSGSDKSISGMASEDEEPKRKGNSDNLGYSSSSLSSYWSAQDIMSGPGRPPPPPMTTAVTNGSSVAGVSVGGGKNHSLEQRDRLNTASSAASHVNQPQMSSNAVPVRPVRHNSNSRNRQTTTTFSIAEEDERMTSDADTLPLLLANSTERQGQGHHHRAVSDLSTSRNQNQRLQPSASSHTTNGGNSSVILNMGMPTDTGTNYPISRRAANNTAASYSAFFSRCNSDVR